MKLLRQLAEGVEFPNKIPAGLCTACCEAKMTEENFKNERIKATRCFQYLYMDVVTCFPVKTPEAHENSLTVIDKY
jgi:hypothetical protein